jgi:3-dehydroquinate synthetase
VYAGNVVFGSHEVPYRYGVDCTDALLDAVLEQVGGGPVLFVVDRAVLDGHARPVLDRLRQRVALHPFVVEAEEHQKRLTLVETLLEYAVERGFDRGGTVIAMGGGLVANVGGLTAALLYRGVRLIHLPTTPIAAFDAVLSLKQAVNLRSGKNLCGTYFPPALIACDLAWLATIPHREMLTGVAEMAKNVLAVVPEHTTAFETAVTQLDTRQAAAVEALWRIGFTAKEPLLARDPRERRAALVFEYGHTVGHALEFMSGGTVGHGEAVAWGMLVAAEVSAALGYLDEAALSRHYRVVGRLRLPTPGVALSWVDPAGLRAAIANDNKHGYLPGGSGDVPMVLLRAPGATVTGPDGLPLTMVPDTIILTALGRVTARAGWRPERAAA